MSEPDRREPFGEPRDALPPRTPLVVGAFDAGERRVPLISVVIPTHNRATLVRRAIGSVLQQTHAEFEVVVVDDASVDGTEAVVAGIQDARIRLLRLNTRSGPARARNHGIQASRGELVALLDSDDEWVPTKLERQVSCLAGSADPERTLVYCFHARRDTLTDRTITQRTTAHEGSSCFAQLVRGWGFVTSSPLLRRSLLLTAGGFDETLPAGEDHDLWLRLAAAGVHFAAVSEALVLVHHHAGPQLSADPAARHAAIRLMDAKWKEAIRTMAGSSSYRQWRARQYGLLQQAQLMRIREAAVAGARWAAWRECLAMCRGLPWSRRFLLQALVFQVCGPGAYGALARAEHALRGHRRGP